ncbi:RhoGAP domain-containing protein [Vibrio anguillarum]
MKCVVRKEKELNKLLDKQVKLNIKLGKTKEAKAKNAVKQLCEMMAINTRFIESEGIFRISPNKTDADKYKNNAANLLSDIGENNVSDMNVVALVIKDQLKNSLTTSDHQMIASCIERLRTNDNLVFQQQDLPTSIADVVKLCKKIIDEPANKMNAESLGIVLGANMVPDTTVDPDYYHKCNHFFKKLLEQREIA